MTLDLADHDRVLVVEDDEALAHLLEEEVVRAGFEARSVRSGEEAKAILTGWPADAVICDLRLPGGNGFELLRHVRAFDVAPAFLVITAFGTVTEAVDALKAGADDFLTKPLDLDHLRLCLVRVLETRRLRRELHAVRAQLRVGDTSHGMVGRSRVMRTLVDQICHVARASGAVLIVGESGTGKELVARAIHAESARAHARLLAVNCAAIPEPLMESELFGHVSGAFTGATQPRRGLFAEADGGTLLLDEIAELAPTLQAKLLRVLEDGRIRPVGSNREQSVDVRIIAASNRDLESEIAAGRFRADLLYRLETFTLRVPPLREREDDLELLVARFVERAAAGSGKEVRAIAPEAMAALRSHPFTGNVRELQNAIERAVAFCHEGVVMLDMLPERVRQSAAPSGRIEGADAPLSPSSGEALCSLAQMERRYIEYVLRRVGGNKRRAAAILGIGRRTLYRHLNDASRP